MREIIFETAAELCGGKEDEWFCIAAVLAAGYARNYWPARIVSFEKMREQLSKSQFESCVLADNPCLGADGQYKLRRAIADTDATDYCSVNGWLENEVSGKTVFAFLSQN